jgi:DNA-binding Xre family transcriptional regulator
MADCVGTILRILARRFDWLVGRVSPWNPPRRQGRPAKPSIAPTGDRGTLVAFGARVRRRREDLGWSQRRLAEWLDTDSSYVARIERGHLAVRISMLIRLAEALELDPGDLLHAKAIAPRARAAPYRLPTVGVAGNGIAAPASLASIGTYTNA